MVAGLRFLHLPAVHDAEALGEDVVHGEFEDAQGVALGGGADAVEPVLQRLGKTRSNAEFLSTLNREV